MLHHDEYLVPPIPTSHDRPWIGMRQPPFLFDPIHYPLGSTPTQTHSPKG